MNVDNCFNLILGTNYYSGSVEALDRQRHSQDSILKLKNVDCINLQFNDGIIEVDGFRNVPKLDRDSIQITGRTGSRKPLLLQVFDLLANEANSRGVKYFCWVNADIIVLQAMVDVINKQDLEAYLFSRIDIDIETSERLGVFHVGIDAFVFRVDFWKNNRYRFNNYILGEGLFDPVVTSIVLCHSNGILYNNKEYILHPNHEQVWKYSPYSDWNIFLASRDFLYLEKWNYYSKYLKIKPPLGISDESMESLQREMFVWQPSAGTRMWQFGRTVKSYIRYYMNKIGLITSVHYPV